MASASLRLFRQQIVEGVGGGLAERQAVQRLWDCDGPYPARPLGWAGTQRAVLEASASLPQRSGCRECQPFSPALPKVVAFTKATQTSQ